ncbi:MAG: zf-HC2 domain-containing protein [Acidobacteria bacterium]|nr:zf-HC2 domain-containing protein [Acidobacteriota bacterium]MBI3664281.1 zf-HC2 domain-containing protein [Acidobacteriota bacterium]
MAHFDEMTCLLYLDGQLDRERATELSEHVETCAECRTLLAALESESRLLRGALTEEEESVPARLLEYAPETKAREAAPLAWLVTLGFAGAGAYTLWSGIVEPWQQQLSQAGFGGDSFLAMLFFGGVFWKGWETMVNLTELLAAATLVILAVALFRRNSRHTPTVAVVLGALACVLALPLAASAAEIRKAGTVTVATDEVIKNDLVAVGESVRIEGTVEGDAILCGQTLTVNGHVKGDVIAFGEFVRINGQVDGNARVFSKFFALEGNVAKNVSIFAQTLEFPSKSQIGGSLMLFAARASQDGRVGRDLMAFVAKYDLNGMVGGTGLLQSDRLTIGPSADIQGKVSITAARQPSISEKAKFGSGPPAIKIETHRPDYASPGYYWHQTLRWGAAFMLGLVLALLMPGFLRDTMREGERYGLSLGAGVLALIVTPIAAVIACITIVGVAVGILAVLAWGAALYAAQVFVGAFLGQKMLGAADSTGALLGRMAVGLLVIRVAGMIPYAGHLAWLIVVVFGLGVVTLAIVKRARPEPAAM